MDYSYDGLIKTLNVVNMYSFSSAGVGMNLGEAAAPAYLDTLNGRIAFISKEFAHRCIDKGGLCDNRS